MPVHVPQDGPIKLFIGTDDYQMLGARVLEHTIRNTSSLPVDIRMLNAVSPPTPHRAGQTTQTGFSFTRFMIPELCGYSGRAIYLDADMLVFGDIAELWRWPMLECQQLLYVRQPPRRKRQPQYSVFIVDCGKARWDIRTLIDELDDGRYDYQDLVYQFCHVPVSAKSDDLPFRWNSLESYTPGETSLIHYTDMDTQPWISRSNRYGHLFYKALRDAIDDGVITSDELLQAINKGCVSPLLPKWIGLSELASSKSVLGWTPPYFRLIPQRKRWQAKIRRALRETFHISPR